jgi:hypothetical protein
MKIDFDKLSDNYFDLLKKWGGTKDEFNKILI